MKARVALPLGLVIAIAAAVPSAAQPAPAKGGVVETGTTKLTATVVRVDMKTRNVDL